MKAETPRGRLKSVSRGIFYNVLIGLTQQYDKLVFVALPPNFLSLRDQSADWSWQSPG